MDFVHQDASLMLQLLNKRLHLIATETAHRHDYRDLDVLMSRVSYKRGEVSLLPTAYLSLSMVSFISHISIVIVISVSC